MASTTSPAQHTLQRRSCSGPLTSLCALAILVVPVLLFLAFFSTASNHEAPAEPTPTNLGPPENPTDDASGLSGAPAEDNAPATLPGE